MAGRQIRDLGLVPIHRAAPVGLGVPARERLAWPGVPVGGQGLFPVVCDGQVGHHAGRGPVAAEADSVGYRPPLRVQGQSPPLGRVCDVVARLAGGARAVPACVPACERVAGTGEAVRGRLCRGSRVADRGGDASASGLVAVIGDEGAASPRVRRDGVGRQERASRAFAGGPGHDRGAFLRRRVEIDADSAVVHLEKHVGRFHELCGGRIDGRFREPVGVRALARADVEVVIIGAVRIGDEPVFAGRGRAVRPFRRVCHMRSAAGAGERVARRGPVVGVVGLERTGAARDRHRMAFVGGRDVDVVRHIGGRVGFRAAARDPVDGGAVPGDHGCAHAAFRGVDAHAGRVVDAPVVRFRRVVEGERV